MNNEQLDLIYDNFHSINELLNDLVYAVDNAKDAMLRLDDVPCKPCDNLYEWANNCITILPNNISLKKAIEIEECLKNLIKE